MKIQCSGYCTNNFQTEEYITYIHPTIAFHSLESIRVTKICPFHSNNYKISRKGIPPYRKTHFVYHHEILTPGEMHAWKNERNPKEIPRYPHSYSKRDELLTRHSCHSNSRPEVVPVIHSILSLSTPLSPIS